MATKVREKLLQKCLIDLFELPNQELQDIAEYMTVLRYRAAGRRRTPKDFEKATKSIEQRMAARSVTMQDIESEIRKVRQTKFRHRPFFKTKRQWRI